jgi:hypothetical protein
MVWGLIKEKSNCAAASDLRSPFHGLAAATASYSSFHSFPEPALRKDKEIIVWPVRKCNEKRIMRQCFSFFSFVRIGYCRTTCTLVCDPDNKEKKRKDEELIFLSSFYICLARYIFTSFVRA